MYSIKRVNPLPENWQENSREVVEESSDVFVWSELEDDLEPHQDLGGDGGCLLQ